MARAGCLEGVLAFSLTWTSVLTLKPRLRLRGHELCEVASTGLRSEGKPTSAASLTSLRPCDAADEWQMRLDCAQMENDFLRKRLQQCEERLDSEMKARKELEQKVRDGGGSGPLRPWELVPSPLLGERPLCCPVLSSTIGINAVPVGHRACALREGCPRALNLGPRQSSGSSGNHRRLGLGSCSVNSTTACSQNCSTVSVTVQWLWRDTMTKAAPVIESI